MKIYFHITCNACAIGSLKSFKNKWQYLTTKRKERFADAIRFYLKAHMDNGNLSLS